MKLALAALLAAALLAAVYALDPMGTAPGPADASASTTAFHGTVARIGPRLRARMSSWHPGCPVPIRNLRVLTLDHWGFDGTIHRGRLIVHRYQAWPVLRVMHRLFDVRFPIRRMWLIDKYGADDDKSMEANNTSAFNCRFVEGTQRWSEHAYGRAIDINPIQNPYVSGSHVSPDAGRAYVDRSRRAKGMIHGGDAVVRAFASIGWKWGGYWTSPKDYQHFSSTGR